MSLRLTLTLCALIAGLSLLPAPAGAQEKKAPAVHWEKDLRESMWHRKSCAALESYIWEVGSAQGVIARDFSLGGNPPSPDTPVPMQDVSAFVFATYLLERQRGELTPEQTQALTMRSGYNAPSAQRCDGETSVEGCFGALGGKNPPAEAGSFYYGPGHIQKLAMDLGLGSYMGGDLRDEYSAYLGDIPGLTFGGPRVMDDLSLTPVRLSKLLQGIVGGDLYMYESLGRDSVCLDPASCKQNKVLYAPAPRTRDYSLGHWVEKDALGRIDGYSANSPSGLYVWISADKNYYGYVMPRNTDKNMSMDGLSCGRGMMWFVYQATGGTGTP